MSRSRKRDYNPGNPLSNGRGMPVVLLATNGREVFRGDVREAYLHTWLGLFMGYRTDTHRRVFVNVTYDLTQVCEGQASGPWVTYDNPRETDNPRSGEFRGSIT